MRILIWHVHGSWTTAFVHGRHDYLLPTTPDRCPDGLGRARTWDWPSAAREVSSEALADEDVDVVVLQRPHEVELAEKWLGGRRPGRDLPAVYLEHNTPRGHAATSRHPVADRGDVLLVHVTHFNRLMWDAGSTRTAVVEHGVVDPGHRYTGELPAAAVAVNEPLRRGRITGTDLLARFARTLPLHVFGIGTAGLDAALGTGGRVRECGDLPQHRMHAEMARRRIYLHMPRWTSLGLSLIEAMHLGMPVVALGTTEAAEAVPPEAGCCCTDPDQLDRALRALVSEPELARRLGAGARAHALARYGLDRFLSRWDALLADVAERPTARVPAVAVTNGRS
jgi:hypothetical protein